MLSRALSTGLALVMPPALRCETPEPLCCPLQVKQNAPLMGVVVTGANALPASIITEAFGPQQGKTLNYRKFGSAVERLNTWYEDRGILGQVRTLQWLQHPKQPSAPIDASFRHSCASLAEELEK